MAIANGTVQREDGVMIMWKIGLIFENRRYRVLKLGCITEKLVLEDEKEWLSTKGIFPALYTIGAELPVWPPHRAILPR